MTKIITDHKRVTGQKRMYAYLFQEYRSTIHPAILMLHRRSHVAGDKGRKIREYVRIERGREI